MDLYLKNNNQISRITDVIGGAFMPSINKEGKILYSLFEDGKYKIAITDINDSSYEVNQNYR